VGSAGEGRLNIQGGGVVLSADGFIGAMAGSVGTASVTGRDGSGNPSTWTNAGNLRIGYQGFGTLAIEEGGSVSTEFGFIGQEQDSTGTVTVSGADSIWTNTTLNIGGGGMGTLNILDGGEVLDDVGKAINGVVIVSGADLAGNPSKWTNGELAVGANDALTGELMVQDGGSVSATFANIGSDAGSIGMASVTGAGSTWTNVMFLRVGDSGTGTLTIEDGGRVTSDGDGYLGNMMGSEGTATVTGAGSSWMIAEELRVGNMGLGTLMIQNGGSVDNENGAIGYNSGSDGTVTVTGPNAMWANHSSLRVANSGAGTLSIESGGSVGSPDGSIAAEANSTGMVNVSGDGSAWNISGRLAVGGNAATATGGGTGAIRIQSGGVVSVAEDILLFSDGRVDLEGGTLSAATIDRSGGEFDWTGGTLHVELFNGNLINQGGTLAPGHTAGSTTVVGDYTQQAGAALEIEIGGTLVAAEHDFVNVTDTALLGGELHVALIDGFVPDPLDTFTIFNADALLGFFSNVTNGQRLETLDGTGSFLAHYGPTSAFAPDQIVLTDFDLSDLTGIPGDYNGNGLVEQADLDLVLGNWGADAAVPPANWINDIPSGFIDQDELDRVLGNWGTSADLRRNAAVPEPASWCLAALLISVAAAHGPVFRARSR
jgi:T5SS/PEP-CTERM-associated repeat protein